MVAKLSLFILLGAFGVLSATSTAHAAPSWPLEPATLSVRVSPDSRNESTPDGQIRTGRVTAMRVPDESTTMRGLLISGVADAVHPSCELDGSVRVQERMAIPITRV
jgi:hypothetical protein